MLGSPGFHIADSASPPFFVHVKGPAKGPIYIYIWATLKITNVYIVCHIGLYQGYAVQYVVVVFINDIKNNKRVYIYDLPHRVISGLC